MTIRTYPTFMEWARDWLRPADGKKVVRDGSSWINPTPFNRRGWWSYCSWKDVPGWFWYGLVLPARFRLNVWWFWWSFPLRRSGRCPQCAGKGSYGADYGDVLPCGMCGRTGRSLKFPRRAWHLFP